MTTDPLIWEHWQGNLIHEGPRSRILRPKPYARRVRVLPGNPSLPLRVMLRELSVRGTRMNGGLNGSDLGIDLTLRGNEVRKLFYSGGFVPTLVKEGIDPEEVLQEIFKAILVRNRGIAKWDHRRSSFGHYIWIVVRCVMSNYLRKDRRRTANEEISEDIDLVGLVGEGDEEFVREDLLAGTYPMEPERSRVRQFLQLLETGMSRREALEQLGEKTSWGDQVIRTLRAAYDSP